ncbi:DUF6600 domain-containing protein [Thermaurantiacus sp.]
MLRLLLLLLGAALAAPSKTGPAWGSPVAAAPVPAWWGQSAPGAAAFVPALRPFGTWVRHPAYGDIWCPRVPAGWQPYAIGHWARHPRFGWRWVSAEPFGWAVFHYGRWAWEPRFGWFWVPGIRFAPHWVSFRLGRGWIGWAPLPPSGFDRWSFWAAGGWGFDNPGWVFVADRDFGRPWDPWHHRPARRPDRKAFARAEVAAIPRLPVSEPVPTRSHLAGVDPSLEPLSEPEAIASLPAMGLDRDAPRRAVRDRPVDSRWSAGPLAAPEPRHLAASAAVPRPFLEPPPSPEPAAPAARAPLFAAPPATWRSAPFARDTGASHMRELGPPGGAREGGFDPSGPTDEP